MVIIPKEPFSIAMDIGQTNRGDYSNDDQDNDDDDDYCDFPIKGANNLVTKAFLYILWSMMMRWWWWWR